MTLFTAFTISIIMLLLLYPGIVFGVVIVYKIFCVTAITDCLLIMSTFV